MVLWHHYIQRGTAHSRFIDHSRLAAQRVNLGQGGDTHDRHTPREVCRSSCVLQRCPCIINFPFLVWFKALIIPLSQSCTRVLSKDSRAHEGRFIHRCRNLMFVDVISRYTTPKAATFLPVNQLLWRWSIIEHQSIRSPEPLFQAPSQRMGWLCHGGFVHLWLLLLAERIDAIVEWIIHRSLGDVVG